MEATVQRPRRPRYTTEQRKQILIHVAELMRGGLTAERAIAESGLSKSTFYKWKGRRLPRRRRRSALRRVVLAPATIQRDSPLVVVSPAGLRVEGLSIDGVAELLRQLG